MDRVATARAALDAIFRRVGGYFNPARDPGVETSVMIDAERGQYGLFRVGWDWKTRKRVSNTVFLARIKDGKVWIEEDNTDFDLADELVKAGVPREDIVLGFLHPDERRYSDFAVA